jgi:Enhancer of polycomb-like
LESELARQVEYDMDEQGVTGFAFCRSLTHAFVTDKAWLDAVNAERKKEQVDAVSYEAFEVIMDRLEKEWFDLVRCSYSPRVYANCTLDRQNTFQNPTLHCHLKTRRVLYATILRARTAMLSSSAMAATLPCTKVRIVVLFCSLIKTITFL